MTETPWTLGPWYVDEDYPCNVSTAYHQTIAETCDSWFNLEISRANARLIAAAPELVAALEWMLRVVDTIPWVAEEVPDGLAPMFYGTLTAEGDRKVHGQYLAAKALLARVRGEEIQG